MLGAILGDMVGSPFEFDHNNYKHKDFPLLSERSHFTDDTVMTLAVARGLIAGQGDAQKTFAEVRYEMRRLGNVYPDAGYGGMFRRWLCAEHPTAALATAPPCGWRRQAGCSTRWTKRWKWRR